MLVVDGISYGLSGADLADRRAYINASEAPTICSGDADRRLRLWMEKTGKVEPEDLSDVLPVAMGSYTEPFNVMWFEKSTGMQVIDRQRIEKIGFLRATLDGMVKYEGAACVWEAKHIGAFSKIDEAVQRYMPQLHVQMYLTDATQAILSILHGTQKYEWVHIRWDASYWRAILELLEDFQNCISFNMPPADAPALTPPMPVALKNYDLTGNNLWASHAADWLASKSAADTFKAAEKNIKSLVPEDASDCTGHGITVKRSKAGALTVKESKK